MSSLCVDLCKNKTGAGIVKHKGIINTRGWAPDTEASWAESAAIRSQSDCSQPGFTQHPSLFRSTR